MPNKFREVFGTSPEYEVKRLIKILNIILESDITINKDIELVQYSDDKPWLYVAKPFGGFIGDCEDCEHIYNNHQGLSTGGLCDLHNCGCGYGFVCKDYDGPYPTDFDNPYVSILENELKMITYYIKNISELLKRMDGEKQ